MSSFTALNLSAEDIAFDAEEHTRELQVSCSLLIGQGTVLISFRWNKLLRYSKER